jgi:hypothetical protein
LPSFSVTSRTARTLPLYEWVNRRCKARTLPHLLSFVARYALGVGERCGEWLASRWRTIAPLRLKPHQRLAPSSSALSQKPISPVLSREGPRGSLPAFASGDVADMSICLTQPVSPLLPRSLRFLPDVISAPPSVHFAVDFPICRERYGLILFRWKDAIG